ncbi:MAG: hypothetical protein ABJC89_02475 [Acidobacteriota bacterium]
MAKGNDDQITPAQDDVAGREDETLLGTDEVGLADDEDDDDFDEDDLEDEEDEEEGGGGF